VPCSRMTLCRDIRTVNFKSVCGQVDEAIAEGDSRLVEVITREWAPILPSKVVSGRRLSDDKVLRIEEQKRYHHPQETQGTTCLVALWFFDCSEAFNPV
jgi:DNA recombination-dependent growth factor C